MGTVHAYWGSLESEFAPMFQRGSNHYTWKYNHRGLEDHFPFKMDDL